MTRSQISSLLTVILFFVATPGCTKQSFVPTASEPTAVFPASVSEPPALSATPLDAPELLPPPIALVAFEESAEPQQADEPTEPAPETAAEPAARLDEASENAGHYRQRILGFAAEARATAVLLDRHGATAEYDDQCAKMMQLLDRARSADEDDQFDATTQHANLILQKLRLGRTYLLQRDDLGGMRSPGAVKLLRDIYKECSRLARDEQEEIASLRGEIEAK